MGILFSFQSSHLPMLMSSLMSCWPRITPVIQPCLASRKGLFLVRRVKAVLLIFLWHFALAYSFKKSWILSFVSGLFEQMGSWSVWNSRTEKKCTWGRFWGRRGRQGGTAYGNWWTQWSWKCEHFTSESTKFINGMLNPLLSSFQDNHRGRSLARERDRDWDHDRKHERHNRYAQLDLHCIHMLSLLLNYSDCFFNRLMRLASILRLALNMWTKGYLLVYILKKLKFQYVLMMHQISFLICDV